MKRRNIIFIMLAMVATTAVAHNFEVKNADGASIWYNDVTATYGSNAVEVTFSGTWYNAVKDEYKNDIVIPDSITTGGNKYRVVGIGEQAFSFCSSLKSITIPESIEYIKDKAFEACYRLMTVNYNAINCKDLTLPQFAPFSFGNMAYSEYVYDADGDPESFWSAYGLRTVNIGANVEHIPAYMFYGMGGGLQQADLTVRPIKIENSKVGVTKINFLGSPKSIGNQAFRACRLLREITIPAGVTSLGQALFANCDTLSKVVLPEGIEEIPAYFFSTCKEMSVFNLPSTVKAINFESFKNCEKLTEITLPEGLTTVGPSAFRACENLKTVNLPSSLTSIDGYAFSDCTSLEEITIPAAVEGIGNYAFEDCTHLKTVKMEGNTKLIGNFVFAGCMNLSAGEFYAPKKMPQISDNTFEGVSNTMKVIVEGGDETEYRQDENWGRFFMPTAVENVEKAESRHARKVMRDGAIYIEKEGRYFDILGSEVKLKD